MLDNFLNHLQWCHQAVFQSVILEAMTSFRNIILCKCYHLGCFSVLQLKAAPLHGSLSISRCKIQINLQWHQHLWRAKWHNACYKWRTLVPFVFQKLTEFELPHIPLGDKTRPFKEYTMRPYSTREWSAEEAILNYRESSACRMADVPIYKQNG
jgi:hypothetical protein